MEYVKIGKVVNTFGLKGELKIESMTDFVEERFRKGQQLYIDSKEGFKEVSVLRKREHKGFLLVTFKDLEDINLVEQFKGYFIYIAKDRIHELPAGQYYYFQLKGCSVYDQNNFIGTVENVEDGYQTILRIRTEDKEILVPYVDAFIKGVDVGNKRIDVNLIEGFL